jgi:formylglycine-generating enzyme required for sulfatase activity
MKKPIVMVIAGLLITSCACAQGNKRIDPKVQQLIDHTLKNMVFVKGGSFMMGDPGEKLIKAFGDQAFKYYTPYENNKPAHKVTLDSYYIDKFEVTYREHDLFSTVTGRELTDQTDLERAKSKELSEFWRKKYREQRAPGIPAGVSWHGAKDYCKWLGEQTGLPFELPTEAQWEYAARSRGKLVPFATNTGLIERGVNYPRGLDYPNPPGKFPPNPLGLFDMSGNAAEWAQDWYDPDYYSRSPEHNPQGPKTGTKKVVRGGGVYESPGRSTTVVRYYSDFGYESVSGLGFRCVINTDKPLPVGK